MRKLMTLVAAALTLGVVVPNAAQAQGKVRSSDVIKRKDDDRNVRRVDERRDDRRYDNDCYDRNGRYDRNRCDDRYDDRYDRNDKRNGNGPAFCRSGAGHPVYGRQWCYDKGYGLGNNRDRAGQWQRVTWSDVIFRRYPRSDNRIGRAGLIDLLGGSVFNRLDAQRRYFGVNAPMQGNWNRYEGQSVLLLSAGGFPIAELVDRNGDRRVDYILLNRR
jgi:hypothetical protein